LISFSLCPAAWQGNLYGFEYDAQGIWEERRCFDWADCLNERFQLLPEHRKSKEEEDKLKERRKEEAKNRRRKARKERKQQMQMMKAAKAAEKRPKSQQRGETREEIYKNENSI